MGKITFKSAWDDLEKKLSYPKKARKICTVDYNEFKQKVLDENPDFVKEITLSLFNGDIYILKGGYTKEFMQNLKSILAFSQNFDKLRFNLKLRNVFKDSEINLLKIYIPMDFTQSCGTRLRNLGRLLKLTK